MKGATGGLLSQPLATTCSSWVVGAVGVSLELRRSAWEPMMVARLAMWHFQQTFPLGMLCVNICPSTVTMRGMRLAGELGVVGSASSVVIMAAVPAAFHSYT